MATPKRVLVVEDEADLAELVAFNLGRAGYDAAVASDGRKALEMLRAWVPDLIVLDLMLPELTGEEVARAVRTDPRTAAVPILMLTARSTEADQVAGFRAGADDYVVKPFSMKVLTARVGALLRRTAMGDAESSVVAVGTVEADLGTHEVRVDGQPVSLTLTEFRLLVAMMRHSPRAMPRRDLVSRAIGPDVIVTARTIDVHVAALRRKLGDAGGMIRTVRGVGYRITAEDVEATDAQAARVNDR